MSIKLYKIAYLIYRKRTKISKVCVVNGGKMSDENWERCMEILNEMKK